MSVETVYFLRVGEGEPSGFGLGTEADPIRVLPGEAGTEQANAILDFFEFAQGFRPESRGLFAPKPVAGRARSRSRDR